MRRYVLTTTASQQQYAIRAPSTIGDCVLQARSSVRLYREAKAAGTVPKKNSGDPFRGTIELPLPVKQTLLNPFIDDVAGEKIRQLNQGDWPGGVVQQFRALRPLVDGLLDGYSRIRFAGMLGAPEDGMAVWRGDGTTVVTNVIDLTFSQFARLCAGELEASEKATGEAAAEVPGSSILDPEHLVLVVNPGWSNSKAIGQPWDRKLKQQAKQLVDEAQWDVVYCCRPVRTSQDAHGLLVRAFPGKWRLYPRPADDAEVTADCVLEAEQVPDRSLMAALLNEAKPQVERQFKDYLEERERSRRLF